MEVPRAHPLVVPPVEMFGKVVREVFLARVPSYIDIFSCDLVCDPEETHLHGARTLFFDTVIGDAGGCFVIAVHWCRRLGMAQFFKDEPHNFSFLAVQEEGAEFGLRGRGDHEFEDTTKNHDCPIEGDRLVAGRVGTKEKLAGDAATSVGFRQVGCVGVNI